MDASMDQTILRHEVSEINFGFYSDDEIRALSVKQITSRISFDGLKNPVLGGLYDPAMGPIDFNMICPTCHMTQKECPGHLGHIELPVPVYSPVLFATLLNILKRKCMSCHKFRRASSSSRIFRVRLLLLDNGYIEEASQMLDLLEQKDGNFEEGHAQTIQRQQAILDEYERLALSGAATFLPKNPRAVEVERDSIISAFLKGMTYKCENCEAHSPAIRQDSAAKIFLKPLSQRSLRHNKSRAINLNSAFDMVHKTTDGKAPAADDSDVDSDEDMDSDREEASTAGHQYLAPLEVMSQLQLLWQNEDGLTELMWGNRVAASRRGDNLALIGWQKFFLNVIPVAPSRFRPPVIMGDTQFEHAQNNYLSKIISLSEQMMQMNNARRETTDTETAKSVNLSDKIYLWTELQTQVNCLIDNSKAKRPDDMPQGIKQLIEKKEGLFRKHMMGKRVNYAARSVISPDPYIATSEIGVPLRFAKTLTLPQAVTPWNVVEMRQLVENGPQIHPGANFVENERGQLIDLSKRTPDQRRAIGKTLLTRSASAQGAHQKHKVKRVWRHLKSGDVVLMNRQPTLHKPSMMAHVTRVLTNPAMQTIRMHYANCNTFNADFDGDEMNMHFPQNELARAEAYHIANNDNQYLVPTDGSPLRGLIQDHVDSGVKLTQRDTFLTKDMYLQLVYSAWTCLDGEKGVIKTLPPTLLKPQPMWTGKQVMSTILLMLTAGKPPLNLDSKAKIKADLYGPKNAEHIIVFRDGELLQGVLDKAQFGASEYGWVHAVYELYGAGTAAKLLTALGRVLTCYLQYAGHTCALEDLTLTGPAEVERRRLVEQSVLHGEVAYSEFAGLPGLKSDETRRMNDDERATLRETMRRKMAEDLENTSSALDSHMMGFVHGSNSEIIKSCLPHGQNKSFPANCFSLMVLTGAKGSMVNHSQISCGLGQQALEGRRVPVLVSGKSLPSFEPFDPSPRAGGYITDRFLTGLRPQEYYHHCMAGREGLVDTAVKTSRSGYLQRCLVKHLEDLHVGYDHTVRNCDGNVVQFLYGEDGVDTLNSAFLSGKADQMSFLAMNHASLSHKFGITADFLETSGLDVVAPAQLHHEIKSAKRHGYEGGLFEMHSMKEGLSVLARRLQPGHHKWKKGHFALGWHAATIAKVDDSGDFAVYDLTYEDGETVRGVPQFKQLKASTATMPENEYMAGSVELIRPQLPDPVMHALPLNHHIGTVSEKTQNHIESYSKANPSNLLESKKNKLGGVVSASGFRLMVWVKYMRSLCQPGENVGTICAQSIGEPSTQMTLNTFHLAGHGAANVTLGIPRLREIIMTASKKMSTPMMTIPLLPTASPADGMAVEQQLNQVPLAELIRNTKGIRVQDQFLEAENRVLWCREYTIRLYFFKPKLIRDAFGITTKEIQRAFGRHFVSKLLTLLKHEMRKSGVTISVESGNTMSARASDNFGDDDDDAPRGRAKKTKDDDDDDDDEDQGTLKFGAKKEASGYGDMDDEDIAVQRAADSDDDDDDEAPKKKKNAAASSDTENSSDDEDAAPIKVLKGELKDVPVSATVSKNPYFAGAGVNTTEHYGELKLRFPANFKTLLLVPLIEKIAAQVLVRSCPGISRCYAVKQRLDKSGDEEQCIQTAGLNFQAIWELNDKLDVNRLVTNDVYQVLLNYGVEAARASISKQIQDVFGVYGISVDPRHLSLLADYMTHYGDYMPLNRSGMARKGSSFQQITFETSMKFLTEAATGNFGDDMAGPSARIVLGQPVKLGTGSFSLMAPIAL